MTHSLPPLDGVELKPATFGDWWETVPRIRMPDHLMLLAGWIAAHHVLDGGVIEPDAAKFAPLIRADVHAVEGMIAVLRDEYGLLQQDGTGYKLTLPADLSTRVELDGFTGHPETGAGG